MRHSLFLRLLLLVTASLLLFGCSATPAPDAQEDILPPPPGDFLPATIEQLPFEVHPPGEVDSSGDALAELTFRNNSDFPITYLEYLFYFPELGETLSFMSWGTVLPGEISPKAYGLFEEDMTPIALSYSAYADGESYLAQYDFENNHYEVTTNEQWSSELTAPEDVIVTAEELPYELSFSQSEGEAEFRFTNHSDYPITHFGATFHMHGENNLTSFYVMGTVMPGETSQVMTAPAEEGMTLWMLEYVALSPDGDYSIQYDKKLGTYRMGRY